MTNFETFYFILDLKWLQYCSEVHFLTENHLKMTIHASFDRFAMKNTISLSHFQAVALVQTICWGKNLAFEHGKKPDLDNSADVIAKSGHKRDKLT